MTENKRLFVGRKTVEDRFTIITDYDGEIGVKENRSGDVLVLKHSDLNAQQFVAQLVVFLNDQNQAIVDLYDGSKYWSDKATEKIKELEEENEQLKTANIHLSWIKDYAYWKEKDAFNKLWGAYMKTCEEYRILVKENEQLKSQLYYDGEEGVCSICKHHYLVKDDESELGYYNLRCKKGHYDCAKVSLRYCEDFEKELKSE